ncbi:polyprenyl synthetase family protein [Tenacibaculum sp. IB213877]|uniref:polyprenyl synthetase family protein n=1 Tax=Tenacibaculum sp. IB213877 TaxID=3097351 RepID=UPI002A5A805A|nr:polyprenyl synthetase family protein [Tenacibaculum sp. IB213877]MDY0780959.1 polyprenyl synthetase family protein [Tenacibaculum sp. IB213877]
MDLSKYQLAFDAYLKTQTFNKEPKNLYTPVEYILQLGGKRVRPLLTLIAADIFSGTVKEALPAAMAVETFHNFTLVHDDIMDEAPLRRGKETVHQKWNINTGILSGDAMLILAYQYFENYEPIVFQKLAQLFSKTALEVCDGQQLDVDFETRNDVTIDEYINMITLKTSVLVAAALKMGAIVAKTNDEQANNLYNYGLNLGIAFQLQDDLLDAFGDPKTFGKQVGGDIIENKKTYLYLKSLEVADATDKEKLKFFFNQKLEENSIKITEVTRIFEQNDIPALTQELIEYYTNKAFGYLQNIAITDDAKQGLIDFGNNLMSRKV